MLPSRLATKHVVYNKSKSRSHVAIKANTKTDSQNVVCHRQDVHQNIMTAYLLCILLRHLLRRGASLIGLLPKIEEFLGVPVSFPLCSHIVRHSHGLRDGLGVVPAGACPVLLGLARRLHVNPHTPCSIPVLALESIQTSVPRIHRLRVVRGKPASWCCSLTTRRQLHNRPPRGRLLSNQALDVVILLFALASLLVCFLPLIARFVSTDPANGY
jgi:hypothetical protein